jgi:biotin-(acetyl-CoA carboxylase) ligase
VRDAGTPRELTGEATDIDAEGRLLVVQEPGGRLVPVSAGDVLHLRS